MCSIFVYAQRRIFQILLLQALALILMVTGCVRPVVYPRLDINSDNQMNDADWIDRQNPAPCQFSPLNPVDTDGDGIFDGPTDPVLYQKARRAKAIWSRHTTHFILRIDSLSRSFQNEFTQLMTDAAILSPPDWDIRKLESYNGIGDAPAWPRYQVEPNLPGGKNTPISLVVIPKKIWDAFGDPDPIAWINNRIENPNLEIVQHGYTHANTLPRSDWAKKRDRNWYACETCGYGDWEIAAYLGVGKQILLGDYANTWIRQAGADPNLSPRIDWAKAANPLLGYAPPFNAFDTNTVSGLACNGMLVISASVFEENSRIFSPNGSFKERFDAFGIFHAPADYQVNPVIPEGLGSFEEYLASITRFGGLNVWLIEEVEWSSRFCNDLPRLERCDWNPDADVNRENNMVDMVRWQRWMTLLDYVNAYGQPMTLGDYALAMAFDNAPTVYNPDQADSDHDGIGDVVDENPLQPDDD